MRTTCMVLVASSVLLAACGDGDSKAAPSPSTTSSTSTPSASASLSPTVPFPATTSPDTEQSGGGLLGVKAARVSPQTGYDRVVIDLGGKGAGRPGWRVEYVAKPTSDGSGNPVAVKGSFFLHVAVMGVGNPDDTGVPEPTVRRIAPAGTKAVREVVLDGVFEGVYTAYVGLSAKQPFRVFRLSNPPRVVIDVRHP